MLYILHATIMGGATISFLKMIEGLRLKGVEAYVVIPSHDEEFEERARSVSANVLIAPQKMSILAKRKDGFSNRLEYVIKFPYRCTKILLQRRKNGKSLCALIESVRPDIIHTNVGVIHEGYWCAKKYGIPHVWHLREYQDIDFNWVIIPSKSIFKKCLKKSNVIAITKDILDYFNLSDSRRFRVIYNPILSNSTTALDFPKKKYFLCASRVSREKGHEDVFRCFSKFHKLFPDYRLIILGFGKGEYIDYLKQLSIELGCENSIEFKGFTDDVGRYMRKAVALVVASYKEGFGRMTAEALFYGCMVIGRNTGGTKEILDETGGLQFSTNDELFSQMVNIVNMPEQEYRQSIIKAQSRAKELYSVEAHIDAVDLFYKEIISANSLSK